MEEIDFHPHALYKMREREISADEVIHAVQDPDDVAPARLGRKCASKKRGDYWLRVIFEERARGVLIITAYVTRRR
jgi:hypothetical protein